MHLQCFLLSKFLKYQMRNPIFILAFVEPAPAVVEVEAIPAVVEEVAAAPAVVEEVAPVVAPEEPKVEGTHF